MLNAKMIVAAALMGIAATTAIAQHDGHKHDDKDKKHQHDDKAATAIKVGDAAPEFSLTDTDGKTVKLSDYKGKVVVLQWFNPQCPAVVQHYEKGANTFNDLYTKYNTKDVVFLAVNSAAKGLQGGGLDLNAKMKKDWKISYPVLLDESGDTGHAYGATNTPQMYIVGKDGNLAYKGAIDNGGFGKNGDKNYVSTALDEILAGTAVTTAETKPYGCSVKYAKN